MEVENVKETVDRKSGIYFRIERVKAVVQMLKHVKIKSEV